ncbi:hypothetical protein RO07_09195 [Pandoraea pulmonicola]|uniref:Uncharacterized protein n=1 Tax=Pandoraea pulmonicola TaxID=93221 RepID=A0AAJ4ZCZ3_PANPU|nr:hypothetical protein RO07_09195 [Pandoraea pulmonicola]SUA90931.1 Uncharacterised protein [Pandoraea pulmonicola]
MNVGVMPNFVQTGSTCWPPLGVRGAPRHAGGGSEVFDASQGGAFIATLQCHVTFVTGLEPTSS